jgi:Type I phosphodiesterase / nucleotide pyrophosphatase
MNVQRSIVYLLILISVSFSSIAEQVLINVWDGAEFLVVRDLYNAGTLTNLRALGGLGELSAVTRCFKIANQSKEKCMAGVTRDSDATMLTGLYANKHRVWNIKDFKPIPDGLTIYEKLRASVPGIKLAQIGKCHTFGKETLQNAVSDMDVFEDCGGLDEPIYPSDAANRAAELITQWSNEPNWLIVVIFPWPDFIGHSFGVHSQEYRDSIVADDQHLGVMVSAMGRKGKIFVIGDHGFGNIDLTTGESLPRGHGTHTPTTLFVERGKRDPGNWFMNQLAPIWLKSFFVE